MTINNPDEYLSNVWDWGILRGCFGETKIEPTDLDGLVERNGKFLVIEAKSPGVPLKMGQAITFESLIRTGYFTVVVVWGKANEPEKITIRTSKVERTFDNANLDKFREVIKQWFEYADKQNRR